MCSSDLSRRTGCPRRTGRDGGSAGGRWAIGTLATGHHATEETKESNGTATEGRHENLNGRHTEEEGRDPHELISEATGCWAGGVAHTNPLLSTRKAVVGSGENVRGIASRNGESFGKWGEPRGLARFASRTEMPW